MLVRVSVVGGPSERRLPPRDLQEVSSALNCTELVILFHMLIGLLLPLKNFFVFCFVQIKSAIGSTKGTFPEITVECEECFSSRGHM